MENGWVHSRLGLDGLFQTLSRDFPDTFQAGPFEKALEERAHLDGTAVGRHTSRLEFSYLYSSWGSGMGRIGVAFRAFFGALGNGEKAERIDAAMRPTSLPAPQEPAKSAEPAKPAPPPKPARSDAVSLLSALQREARFVDFLMEPLDDYTDQQVGAAARDVHRGCATVVQRMFAIAPLLEETEGATVEVPAPLDPDQYRLVGNVAGEPPYQGELTHGGWNATQIKLPTWSGQRESANVVAPAEVELK